MEQGQSGKDATAASATAAARAHMLEQEGRGAAARPAQTAAAAAGSGGTTRLLPLLCGTCRWRPTHRRGSRDKSLRARGPRPACWALAQALTCAASPSNRTSLGLARGGSPPGGAVKEPPPPPPEKLPLATCSPRDTKRKRSGRISPCVAAAESPLGGGAKAGQRGLGTTRAARPSIPTAPHLQPRRQHAIQAAPSAARQHSQAGRPRNITLAPADPPWCQQQQQQQQQQQPCSRPDAVDPLHSRASSTGYYASPPLCHGMEGGTADAHLQAPAAGSPASRAAAAPTITTYLQRGAKQPPARQSAP